ncbi:MAG: 3-hydroxyacyl-ACP dehydratase [Niabella sp.]
MLNNNLYTVNSLHTDNGSTAAHITVNENHPIFEGHFPGQPVLPGVCMMQICKELIEKATDQKLLLLQADSSKFLSMVDPRVTPQLIITIDYTIADGFLQANGKITGDPGTFLKFSNYRFKIQ